MEKKWILTWNQLANHSNSEFTPIRPNSALNSYTRMKLESLHRLQGSNPGFKTGQHRAENGTLCLEQWLTSYHSVFVPDTYFSRITLDLGHHDWDQNPIESELQSGHCLFFWGYTVIIIGSSSKIFTQSLLRNTPSDLELVILVQRLVHRYPEKTTTLQLPLIAFFVGSHRRRVRVVGSIDHQLT